MQIPDAVLQNATEAQLLSLLVAWHQFTRPADKALDCISSVIQIGRTTLDQAIVGKGYIGVRRWLLIERTYGFALWRRWLALQEKAL